MEKADSALLEHARLALLRHDPEQATEHLRRYLRRHRDDQRAWLLFAQTSFVIKEISQARHVLEWLADSIACGADAPCCDEERLFLLLVRCCVEQHDLRAARCYAEQAAERHPRLRELLRGLCEDDRPTLPLEREPCRKRRTRSYGARTAHQPSQRTGIAGFLGSASRKADAPRPLFYDLVASDGPPLPNRN